MKHRMVGCLALMLPSFLMTALLGFAPLAMSGPKEEVRDLLPLWRDNAPLCQGAPSAEGCEDGDMTLFNGLLCASGEALGCRSVAEAQDESGRWHRSVRFRHHPELRKDNSFSWDMALGVQLYAVTSGDKDALERWLSWVERSRPCLTMLPFEGHNYCLVRGIPRWCTDDTEKGCTAKPQSLALLYRTVQFLGAKVPSPAENTPPDGLGGIVVRSAIEEAREANAALSLERLFAATRDLQPELILIDAAVNREGYPRHLTATEILLFRATGSSVPDVDYAAIVLARREPHNAFFAYLVSGPNDEVARKLLALAPRTASDLPAHKADWTWQRAGHEEAWKRAKLWDFVFMGNLATRDSLMVSTASSQSASALQTWTAP
ncbi:hypothetical protein [Lysobacter sp. 22409]|uniref:hypothetical protein n=1 Tax=Lysobacter sp. 22409 TaxID=3453917 RepID=UPI003F82717D